MFAVLPIGWGKSLFSQIVPKVCEYLHDQGLVLPKAAILVAFSPLSSNPIFKSLKTLLAMKLITVSYEANPVNYDTYFHY